MNDEEPEEVTIDAVRSALEVLEAKRDRYMEGSPKWLALYTASAVVRTLLAMDPPR